MTFFIRVYIKVIYVGQFLSVTAEFTKNICHYVSLIFIFVSGVFFDNVVKF